MSFVMFAGCKYFGFMIGERRCCNSDGEIVSENVEKVKKINSNLFFAAAGDENIITLVYEYLTKHNQLTIGEAVTLLNENYYAIYDRLTELMEKQNVVLEGNVDANIGLMSISNNIIVFASFHLFNEKIETKVINHETEDDITLCYLGKGLGSLGTYFYELFMKNPVFTISNLKSVFYQTIKDNVKTDFTINDRFIAEQLVRKDIYNERKERPK